MNDPGKYVRLSGMLLLLALGFLITLLLLFLALRLLFGFVNGLPWITYVYTLFLLSVPATIFLTAFIIFFIRTKKYPSVWVRFISFFFIILAVVSWIVFYIIDIISFFQNGDTGITDYKSWDLLFLFASVACIFFIGVLQALNEPKEDDWFERNRKNRDNN